MSDRPASWWNGPLGTVAYVLGVAAIVALIAWLAPMEAPTPAAAPGTTTTTTTPRVDVTVPVSGEEPIADAAAVILPSVVHIQTPGGVGSGVIYDNEGRIITAAHVVGNHQEVQVRWSNGVISTGRVIGAATEVDVAVIEAEPSGLPPARFNLQKPRVGQLAIAVGSPWGLASTVTAGIVSAVDQTNCGGDTCAAMVQTDAAINPGNSGGALIDRDGEVIGINVSIYTISGANDGVGFAVPSAMVVDYANAIIAGEPIPTPFLGVGIDSATTGRAGARVTEVISGTAAEAVGIRVDDVIVAVEGVPVLTMGDLVAQVRAHRPGSTVTLDILRGDEMLTLDVTLGIRTDDES
jgi:S1-C subfamily serine protease